MNSRTSNQGKAMPRIKQGGRDAIIAANEHRKEVLKQFDRNIMAAIRALGGTATFYDVHRAALAAENMLRTYQTVDAAFNAMMHDPSPLRIRETSCSSMYAFTLSRAVEQGYIDPHYKAVADRGYQGVLKKISLGSDGRTNLTDISVGTNVGDYAYYVGRERATNDLHGLGAFLIMNEQFVRAEGGPS